MKIDFEKLFEDAENGDGSAIAIITILASTFIIATVAFAVTGYWYISVAIIAFTLYVFGNKYITKG